MYGIFMECVVIFKLYTGLRYIMVLYLAALVFLLIKEKNKCFRVVLVAMPLVVLFLFMNPLFRKGFVAIGLDGETYYRMLWLLPSGVTIAYAACLIFRKHKRIGLVVMGALVMLGGRYVYNSPYITKAENLYHLPETAVKVCDFIAPEEGEERIIAAFPESLIHYVRQYDTNIKMPYGRDMVVDRWGYYNEVYEVIKDDLEVIDTQALIEATRNNYCNYVILHLSQTRTHPLEEEGLTLLAVVEEYQIYRDPVVYEMIEEINRQNERTEEVE